MGFVHRCQFWLSDEFARFAQFYQERQETQLYLKMSLAYRRNVHFDPFMDSLVLQ